MPYDTSKISNPGMSEYIKFINSQGGISSDPNSEESQRLLAQVRQYDPTASWQDASNGEGGWGQFTLSHDRSKLPQMEHGNFNNTRWAGDDNSDRSGMLDSKATWKDSMYGNVTRGNNFKKQKPMWWEYAAPLAVGALAPWAAGAFYGSTGIGLGAAGTQAVTSGAAGFGHGFYGAPFAGSGAASGSGGGSWGQNAGRMATRTIQSLGQSGGRLNPTSMALSAAGAFAPPGVGEALRYGQMGMSAYNMGRNLIRSR